MAGPRVTYSFAFIRELNLHRSKEQLEREFANLAESTSEFQEFTSTLNGQLKKLLTKYAGVKSVTMPEQLYVVLRDRGLSFPDPMTVVYDENQKLMFVRYVNLIAQTLFERPDEAVLLTRAVCTTLPISFERELGLLENEQHIVVNLPYNLEEKPLKKWLKGR